MYVYDSFKRTDHKFSSSTLDRHLKLNKKIVAAFLYYSIWKYSKVKFKKKFACAIIKKLSNVIIELLPIQGLTLFVGYYSAVALFNSK